MKEVRSGIDCPMDSLQGRRRANAPHASTTSQVQQSNNENGNAASQPVRTFVCTHKDCGRRFARLEHLKRHALNHTAGQSTCERCRAHFKRPDLLARHMDRHKERDRESGGLGILNTRKRSWKQADGTIVAKRPPQTADLTPADLNGPISPPISHESLETLQEESISIFDIPTGGDFQKDDSGLLSSGSIPSSTEYLSSGNVAGVDGFWTSSFQTQNIFQVAPPTEVGFAQEFQPDTASSFNMPFTTAVNYNWLFDLNMPNSLEDQTTFEFGLESQRQAQLPSEERIRSQEGNQMTRERMPNSFAPSSNTHNERTATSLSGSSHSGLETCGESRLKTLSSRRQEQEALPHFTQERAYQPPQILTPRASKPSNVSIVELERPLSLLSSAPSLPCLDDCTRELILDVIETLRPIGPGSEPISRHNRLRSLSSLQGYLDLFFTRFNTAYPLIHMPTFVASHQETLLILAMLLLGATFSSKDAHQLAVCIHDVMRPAIFVHAGFSPKPELWVLQTILLVECFGKSRAGQKQHDMSHLFHGMLINLIRRSDCQTVQPVEPSELKKGHGDLEIIWQKWAEAEMKKRLALLCFLWDTQHAVLFCQSLCMMAFELRLRMPCSQVVWEARTASEWRQAGVSQPPEPQFLTTLKSYMSSTMMRPPTMNALSRTLILHGLMSIFWDMQRRDQTSLCVVSGDSSSGLDTWRDRIDVAYDVWKADFDAHCAALEARYREQTEAEAEDTTPEAMQHAQEELVAFSASYRAVYRSAQILLNADFLDIQIYAGARHILGRPVQRVDYLRSARVVKEWAHNDPSASTDKSLCAPKAAWHAAAMLREAFHNLGGVESSSVALFHVPWCLYLATLTCWAFHHFSSPDADGPGGSGSQNSAGEEIVWDAKAEMEALIEGMAGCQTPREVAMRQGRERTGGMVWVMANMLERVRWGIVHAGVVVLRGLVPWRMINQYEQ